MGFFDNFKKKNEDIGFPINNPGLGEPPIDSHSTIDKPIGTGDIFTSPTHSPNPSKPLDHRMSMPLGQSINSTPQSPHSAFPIKNENPLKQDFELLSSKLDYLKASIEAVNQRLANIENLVRQDQNNQNNSKKW